MEQRKWLNPMQPQTLQSATILLYLNAAFGVIYLLQTGSILEIISILGGVAGYGIANERKWGWLLGVGTSSLAVILVLLPAQFTFSIFIYLMFRVLLVILLLHPASRGYQKTWFK
jgi:hypothetical protein